MEDDKQVTGGGWGQATAPEAPKAKGQSGKGCLIAAAVVLGACSLCCCSVMGLMGYAYYASPEMREAFGTIGEMVEITQWGLNDPGARAMREAGCTEAMAMESEELARLLRAGEPDAPAPSFSPEDPTVLLTCEAQAAVDCGALVRVYAGAHSAPAERVGIQARKGRQEMCSGVYSSAGEKLGELTGVFSKGLAP